MGLSSLLQQIEKRGKLPPPSKPQSNNEINKTKSAVSAYRSNTGDKYVDPVVTQLKEKRRLEREQAEASKAKQGVVKGSKANVSSKQPRSGNSVPRHSTTIATKPNWRQSSPPPFPSLSPPPPPPAAKKKLNFNELMKKANNIDHDKLSIKISQKSMSPEPSTRKSLPKKTATVSNKPSTTTTTKATTDGRRNRQVTTKVKAKPVQQSRPSLPVRKPLPKVPMPARQPNAKIQERLNQKSLDKRQVHGNRYDEDDDLSDFLVSDEEQEDGVGEDGYNRDEIWAMFNKGRKRKYYEYNDYDDDDDDDDDMEATGADVLEEELRSRLDAEREDRREMEEEKRRALEKQRRKMGR
ncbi:hypothetical protein KGF57_000037 [Candida theae]|uniref:Uncharacterized protein n=1 Tax=Candida theae TaxID=1198502 RepID=A0AAD5BJQ1_9ASCO|nr:uncharacterized protein KGF57_000037 [Candida theae]KAI5968922.1 hypothetical protein KGF57_000037 [Candida theae]